jgi:diguanylate cyclase (GGDEF)-like protein
MRLRRFALRGTAELPPSIHAALVDSLFSNPAPMLAGALCTAVAAVLTAYKTGNDWLWLIALAIVVIGMSRAIQMRQYQRRAPSQINVADAWEIKYQIGALSIGITMGIWCFITIYYTDDPVAHMLCTAVTIATAAGGAGRTYARPWIYHLQILFACGPMAVALVLRGDPYYVSLGVLNVLFFFGLKRITQSLQKIYVDAMLTGERESALASQFDTALNNMPHGLCMFNSEGRLAVVNGRFGEMMRLGADQTARDTSDRDIFAACVLAASLTQADAVAVSSAIKGAKAAELTTLEPGDSEPRALEWTFQPMADGGIVVLVEDITARRQAEARISHLARFDELTGLPNRVSFQNEIDCELSDSHNWSQLSALLFVDLDQFKQVNDTLGHPAGDRLLCAVAERLREMMRPEDYVARFGGDEFVVFLRNIRSSEDAAKLAARIVDKLSEAYELDDHQVEIGASIGIALTSPGLGSDHLLKNADMALYRAKADGRGTYCFFREELAQSIEARRSLEIDLRHAMANEEFELYFQPLVNLKSGRISTCETLLRWNHPVRGPVSPADIIPVAEDMGLIVDLGRWILRRACMECMTWPEAVNVAVNFSSQQFHRRDVLNDVRYALEVSGLPAERLEIEITESSLLRNTQWTREVLSQLAASGVRISLDDFGTGYSSLSYLHTFPLHKVKIDRSFLEGIEGDRPQMLLRGVARLSADLGMSVVVEGIETNEQLELISKDGTVTEAQGYLFSKPVPAAQIRPLLRASHARDTAPVLEVVRAAARSIA